MSRIKGAINAMLGREPGLREGDSVAYGSMRGTVVRVDGEMCTVRFRDTSGVVHQKLLTKIND